MTDDIQRKVDIYRRNHAFEDLAKRFMASTPETDPARQASVGYDEAASPCQVPTSAESACAPVRYPSGREAALLEALENIYMFARREKYKERKKGIGESPLDEIIRFCERGGCKSSPLRSTDSGGGKQ